MACIAWVVIQRIPHDVLPDAQDDAADRWAFLSQGEAWTASIRKGT